MDIVVSVIIGAVAGWLASMIMGSKTTGILGYMILGILGGFVGNWIFNFLNITASGWKGILVTSTAGAIALIVLGGIIFGRSSRKR
ncbi:MAG: hypothetical protein A3D92_17435 [Bacteroidetes bacterium RIFCSPHIGHO2_02_FULL_44_7]|nr:MAG: hypothetical protein A3D92_17435 [Bacteroidetes bacterium RIFCSPHIGHO2_02_FULL_44_7]